MTARIALIEQAQALLGEFAREPAAAGTLEQANRDQAALIAHQLGVLAKQLRAEAA